MDSLITGAARALAMGDPLGALKRVALREDAPALALRGIAMAQLGDLTCAKALLRRATRTYGPREAVARARCIVAEAEIALVSRDLTWPQRALDAARRLLEEHGDRVNAAHARYLQIRRLLLIGHLDEAERTLSQLQWTLLPPALKTVHELMVADIAMRRLRTRTARAALTRAEQTARAAGIIALAVEVESARLILDNPAARLIHGGKERFLLLDEVEALRSSDTLVVDALRNAVWRGGRVASLATRPVLFALLRALAEAWPGDVARVDLIFRAFQGRHADESHRARLRVEIGRLRSALEGFAEVSATREGFLLAPLHAAEVAVLVPLVEERHAEVLALLADGEAWSSSALAIALGTSPRTIQRALEQLSETGKVKSFGRGRAMRWMTPHLGFPTILLLPGPLPGG